MAATWCVPWMAAVLLVAGLAEPASAAIHGVALPGGSRRIDSNLYRSSLGFRKTVRFYKRFLRRRDHDEVPVYRYRGTTVARFLSRDSQSRWLAIHVFKYREHTQIYVIPRKRSQRPAAAHRRTALDLAGPAM